ncbi:MAG: lipopolysaccharide biosynthesis protein [Bacteroidaceae bacterium]|nr:lipopolysaccharide biosynthesis protein [Bacteroidaceae bacterium]
MGKNKQHKGKNSKFWYFVLSHLALTVPRCILKIRYRHLEKIYRDTDKWPEIVERTGYYCRMTASAGGDTRSWGEMMNSIGSERIRSPKVYYLDSLKYGRCFSPRLLWHIAPGDVDYVPQVPSLCKSRPIGSDSPNATLMKLNHVRHFIFVNDSMEWKDKMDKVIFRGAIGQKCEGKLKENRFRFMQMYFGHDMVDAGEVSDGAPFAKPEWATGKLSIYDHLKYKFVMALEGNDVASNLKWVMSSNSIAVMPKPRFETWFMEGMLVPDYHYIQIADDFHDLEEKLNFYIQHPDLSMEIIRHAHEWVDKFRDRRKEDLISYLVLKKYLESVCLTVNENSA